MKKNINITDKLKFAPYGTTLITSGLGILGYFYNQNMISAGITLSSIISLIGISEITKSIHTKEKVKKILEEKNIKFKQKYFHFLKNHFCDRQATIYAIKKYGTQKDLELFYKILEKNKKNADDILFGYYMK